MYHALVIVQGVLCVIGAALVLATAARGIAILARRRRRPVWRGMHDNATPAELTAKHDETCATAPWPHPDLCSVKPGERMSVQIMILADLAQHGAARVQTGRIWIDETR